MEIRRQSGENTVAVIEGSRRSWRASGTSSRPTLKLEVIRDQSRYIYAALHEINLHPKLGSILPAVVLAFMRRGARRSSPRWPSPPRSSRRSDDVGAQLHARTA
jgi:multidrug efflux pump subunit AcrB